MKKQLISLILFLTISQLFASIPEWVNSYGTKSPFSPQLYLTGFSMVDITDRESHIKSRQISLADLTGKIRTKVYSDITLKESEGGDGYFSSSSIITRCTVDITVSGVEYEYYEDENFRYALAHISIDKLSTTYAKRSENLFRDILLLKKSALEKMDSLRNDSALIDLYKAKKHILDIYEQYSLYQSINSGEDVHYFSRIINMTSISDLKYAERDIDQLIENLEDPDSRDLDEALRKAAFILSRQDVSAGNMEVPPFNFEQTSFSSDFGRFGASMFEGALIEILPAAEEKTLFRSNYWLRGENIQLTVVAIDKDGHKTAQATVRFPYDEKTALYNIKPQNFEQSLIALKEFSSGALTDGGIDIDIWTDRGRDEDSPIYEVGDRLQLFMRVNQPAFLQITYHLATGEKVLLERSYYLGMEQVNRVVTLPYAFEVQPPLGIEQLIVTAFSSEPPSPLVIPKKINGEIYEVFASMNAVTAQTRGLVKINNENEIRVGEAMINLMTVEKLF